MRIRIWGSPSSSILIYPGRGVTSQHESCPGSWGAMLEGAVSDQWLQSTVQGEAQKLAARSGSGDMMFFLGVWDMLGVPGTFWGKVAISCWGEGVRANFWLNMEELSVAMIDIWYIWGWPWQPSPIDDAWVDNVEIGEAVRELRWVAHHRLWDMGSCCVWSTSAPARMMDSTSPI